MASRLRVCILPSAEQEVDSIVSYLSTLSEQVARNFTREYRERLKLLASGMVEYPLSHLPELAALGYRACAVQRYVMLYFREEDCVVVAHVFHQR